MTWTLPRRLVGAAAFVALAGAAACNGSGPGTARAAQPPADRAAPSPAAANAHADVQSEKLVVYKSPSCGCCGAWVDHVEEAGFEVEVHDVMNVQPVKDQHGLPGHLGSCHTTLVGGYVVEGHVPADLIRRLLAERPEIAGIAVPGMPLGSPGMEVPSGRKDPYDVIAFTKDGRVSVFASR
jgi:hypothetical protein